MATAQKVTKCKRKIEAATRRRRSLMFLQTKLAVREAYHFTRTPVANLQVSVTV